MGKKHTIRNRTALSGTTPDQLTEGCWLDTSRSLEQTEETDEAEARWQLWIECYEMTVLFDHCWLLSAGCEEEGI